MRLGAVTFKGSERAFRCFQRLGLQYHAPVAVMCVGPGEKAALPLQGFMNTKIDRWRPLRLELQWNLINSQN
jgi:hypothetical protein